MLVLHDDIGGPLARAFLRWGLEEDVQGLILRLPPHDDSVLPVTLIVRPEKDVDELNELVAQLGKTAAAELTLPHLENLVRPSGNGSVVGYVCAARELFTG